MTRWIDNLPMDDTRVVPENRRLVRALAKMAAALDASHGNHEKYVASMLVQAGALVVVERRRQDKGFDVHAGSLGAEGARGRRMQRARVPDPSEPSLLVAIERLARAIELIQKMGDYRLGTVLWELRTVESHLRAIWRQSGVSLA